MQHCSSCIGLLNLLEMVKKEKNEPKIILNRTLMPYSENLQFEDGARVGKMETERSRNLQTAALRKKSRQPKKYPT